MSKFTDIDLWLTEQGDLDVDSSGDLETTEDSFGRAVLQEIRNRLRSNLGDWKLHESLGSNLQRFIGAPLNADTLGLIVAQIEQALSFDGFLRIGEFQIVTLQMTREIAIFRIIVQTSEGELSTSIGYDSDQQRFIGYS